MKLLFPGFLSKVVTLSYDDGVRQDLRLLPILNKYGIKGTFNLNSGLFGVEKHYGEIDASRLSIPQLLSLYDGQEVASHTLTHPHLEELSDSEQRIEYESDLANLSKLFGKPVFGSAYPFGTYNEETLNILASLGVHYARTTKSTYAFSQPYDFLLWHPTIHHRDPLLKETEEKFFTSDEELAIFYLWGHAYEFDIDDNWDVIEGFCKDMASHKEVWKATNEQIYSYIKAARLLYIRNGEIVNPSSKEVFFSHNGINHSLPPKGRLTV